MAPLKYTSLSDMNEALGRSRPKYADEFAIKPAAKPVKVVTKRRKKIEPLIGLVPVIREGAEFCTRCRFPPDQCICKPPENISVPKEIELTPTQAPIDIKAMQRPNAIPRDGGPQLLRGLMLPLPPSKNRYWRSMPQVKKGTKFPLLVKSFKGLYGTIRATTFPSDEAKEYVRQLGEWAVERRFRFGTLRDLRMEILVCPRDRRSVDPVNYEAVLLDALQAAGVFDNDSQVKKCTTELGPIIEGGRVVISMWEINHDPNEALRRMWG